MRAEETIHDARRRWRRQIETGIAELDTGRRFKIRLSDKVDPDLKPHDFCARCGSKDRLGQFMETDTLWGPWVRGTTRLCYRCDNLELAFGARPRPGIRALLERLVQRVRELRAAPE